MRKIFIAIAASLLVAVGSAASLQQVHSKFLQTAQAQQAHDETRDHPTPEHEEEHEGPEEEEPEEGEEEPAEDGEEEPLELA